MRLESIQDIALQKGVLFYFKQKNTHSEKLNFSLIANINKIDTKLFERLLKLWSKNATINEKYYQ
ncbi:TPA: hypothetical protein RW158_001519 [Staphylococcus aureus]|nr:hypothetical protein [Staphylococcus aureus]